MTEESKVRMLSMKEINAHNTKESLWLLIDNVVYDVTKFQDEHPGGVEPLLDQAGKDATAAFVDVGHSNDAKALMKEYKIGELCEEDKKKGGKKSENSSSWNSALGNGSWCLASIALVAVASVVIFKCYQRFSRQ